MQSRSPPQWVGLRAHLLAVVSTVHALPLLPSPLAMLLTKPRQARFWRAHWRPPVRELSELAWQLPRRVATPLNLKLTMVRPLHHSLRQRRYLRGRPRQGGSLPAAWKATRL